MAECALKGSEQVLILGVREAYVQPFDAPNWLDLRIGFFLSITDKTNADLITGLSETIPQRTGGLPANERYWFGLKTNEIAWPRSVNVVFMGYSNTMQGALNSSGNEVTGNSVLSGSDTGISAGGNYWWPHNSTNANWSVAITGQQNFRAGSVDGAQQHFAQVVGGGGAAGYATLFMLRVTRATSGSTTLTMQYKSNSVAHSGDVLFSSTPTADIISSNLAAFPTTGIQTRGPHSLFRIPDSLYFYWPFRNSRLRIHSIGVMKFL